jgi:hypothetical protein
MFRNKTAFVLGAGASWHYGYPTGEVLVGDVIAMAARLRNHCNARLTSGHVAPNLPKYVKNLAGTSPSADKLRGTWKTLGELCDQLADRLKAVRPLVIDYFLGWNASLQDIGKLLIAAVILECEATELRTGTNKNRHRVLTEVPIPPSYEQMKRFDISRYKDDWIRFVTYKLVSGCKTSKDIFENDVSFITFNYDCSLEQHLYRALSSIDLLNAEDVQQFMSDGLFIHVYGGIHNKIPPEHAPVMPGGLGDGLNLAHPESAASLVKQTEFLDRAYEASQAIRTIDPHDKMDDDICAVTKTLLDKAEVIYILGYGFDEANSNRIGLDKALSPTTRGRKSVMFTNYGDHNIINKKASKLLFGSYSEFIARAIVGDPLDTGLIEKSTRNVYDAFEQDFAALEGDLLSVTEI